MCESLSPAAAVSVTRGAGVSASASPIQWTTSPFEYVCVAGKTSVFGVSGTFALSPNSSNSPGAILPPSQVTVSIRSVTVSPSSFVIGFASFTIVTVRFQPGFG